jgi:amidase
VAVAAGLAAAAIGTETSGSLLSPATQNGVVTVKPTVGLISRTGILPIAHSQDTAGPLTRTVRDAAILLNVLAGTDPRDSATLHLKRPPDYTKFLDAGGLKGARIGVPSDPSDPANDFYYRSISPRAQAVMGEVIAALEAFRPKAGSAAPAPKWRCSTATRRAARNTSRHAARSSLSMS